MSYNWSPFSDVAVRQFHSFYVKELTLTARSSKFGAVRNVTFTPYLQNTKGGSGNKISESSLDTVKSEKTSTSFVIEKHTVKDKDAAAESDKKPGIEGLADANKESEERDPKNQEDKKEEGKNLIIYKSTVLANDKTILLILVVIILKKRKKIDFSEIYLDRNFITPIRAMTDFILKPADLETLPKTKRRSPYENEPPITVYWRKDVEAKALLTWGSKEDLEKEISRRKADQGKSGQSIIHKNKPFR